VAARKKKVAGDAGAEGQADPRASLDGAAFLAALSPVARTLEADLLARARASKAVLRGLEERWQREKDAHRTADPFEVWQHAFVEQVAAAWILSAVFVRTLEDRGLLGQNRLAGPGAMDAQRAFFDLAPSLSERDYLLLTFRELSHLPAARALFDARHNPVWMLAPSVEGARTLLGLFRAPSAEAPTFRFGGSDTRFLGDLYQDLSEDVRKRYALLQTPRFVERYILDRTLDRALERFGVSETTVLDPTCGSGHFLLGAFERLREAFLRAEPGLDPREAAQRALDRVAGSDVNPYAVAIARFRLTLAFVEAGQYARLSDAPEPRLHLCVADSLLHGKDGGAQRTLDQIRGVSAEEIWGRVYALEDEEAARDVLGKKYAAVVGNPPYITVKDAAVREEIRRSYPRSAFRSYSLAAPFAERFFQLARSGGAVGLITANSFMKREFGAKLIEQVLPRLDLDGMWSIPRARTSPGTARRR
jgi:SAM-dependent methyltransferase